MSIEDLPYEEMDNNGNGEIDCIEIDGDGDGDGFFQMKEIVMILIQLFPGAIEICDGVFNSVICGMVIASRTFL